MKAIGRYLLFVISLARMSVSDGGEFDDKEEQNMFLTQIFNYHNMQRMRYGLNKLDRREEMDNLAKLATLVNMDVMIDIIPENFGVNYYLGKYKDTELNYMLAELVFETMQNDQFKYTDPTDRTFSKAEGSRQILWDKTQLIGLSIARNDKYYAIVVVYYPRYRSDIPQQPALKKSKPPTIDQGGPSTS